VPPADRRLDVEVSLDADPEREDPLPASELGEVEYEITRAMGR
jgi:hypothetical protein